MTQPTRAEYDQVMIPCYKPADLVMTHGKKCRLYDSQNRSYLDFGGGIAVNSLGNAPKIVRKALKAQSAKLCHISNVSAGRISILPASARVRVRLPICLSMTLVLLKSKFLTAPAP